MSGKLADRWGARGLHYNATQPVVADENEMLQAAAETKIRQVLGAGRGGGNGVISVDPEDPVRHVFNVLSTQSILCVPVLQSATGRASVQPSPLQTRDILRMLTKLGMHSWSPHSAAVSRPAGEFVGLVDALDVATYLARANQFPEISDDKVVATPVKFLVGASSKNQARPLSEEQSVKEALQLFARGVHRLPFLGPTGTIVGLFSQSDVVAFLATQFRRGLAVGMGARSVQQYRDVLGGPWGPNRVVWIAPTASVRQAIATMASSGLTALAVVENGRQDGLRTSGRLVAQLTALDIARIMPTFYQKMSYWLNASILEFVRTFAEHMPRPIIDLPSIPLSDACERLAASKSHHIWLVDSLDTMRPLASLSMTDICRIVAEFRWPSWPPST